MSRRKRHRRPTVQPRDVAAYAAARAAGHLPAVPATPPRLLQGRTASQEARRYAVLAALMIAGVIGLALLAGRIKTPSTWGLDLLVLTVGLGGFWQILRWGGVVGDRNIEEFERGYTTLRIKFGRFRGGSNGQAEGELGPPWDYAGLWVLRNDGSVIAPPDHTVDPPGFYPSPHRPSEYELWSGAAWMGQYRRPPAPHP